MADPVSRARNLSAYLAAEGVRMMGAHAEADERDALLYLLNSLMIRLEVKLGPEEAKRLVALIMDRL